MSNDYYVDNSASYTFTIHGDDKVRGDRMPDIVFGPDTTDDTIRGLLKGWVVQFHMISGGIVEGEYMGFDHDNNQRDHVAKWDATRKCYTEAHAEGFDMDRVDFINIL